MFFENKFNDIMKKKNHFLFGLFNKCIFKTIFLILLTIIFIFIYINKSKNNEAKNFSENVKHISNEIKDNQVENIKVNIFDMNQPLFPESEYDKIKCRKSALYVVKTTICVYPRGKDAHVSVSILNLGAWEDHVLRPFIKYVSNHSDWLVIDVGAQIGQYTLYAAKMGRKVIAIEPFHDNIQRIHKAATLEKITDNIILIKNAVSNKRNEIKKLLDSNIGDNIGGNSLIPLINKTFVKNETDKYLVETIIFDDIIPYMPYMCKITKKKYEKAILKIDIEGFEAYAFEKATLLFDTIDVRVILMEWGVTVGQDRTKVLAMLQFLYDRSYQSYDGDKLLKREDWLKWPFDVIWIRND